MVTSQAAATVQGSAGSGDLNPSVSGPRFQYVFISWFLPGCVSLSLDRFGLWSSYHLVETALYVTDAGGRDNHTRGSGPPVAPSPRASCDCCCPPFCTHPTSSPALPFLSVILVHLQARSLLLRASTTPSGSTRCTHRQCLDPPEAGGDRIASCLPKPLLCVFQCETCRSVSRKEIHRDRSSVDPPLRFAKLGLRFLLLSPRILDSRRESFAFSAGSLPGSFRSLPSCQSLSDRLVGGMHLAPLLTSPRLGAIVLRSHGGSFKLPHGVFP